MSTYSEFYLFARDLSKPQTAKSRYKYIRPYKKNGNPAPLASSGSNCQWLLNVLGSYYQEDQDPYKILQFLGYQSREDDFFKYGYRMVDLDDFLRYKGDDFHVGYVNKKIVRKMEIEHNSYNLDDMLDEGDNVISVSEYAELSDEEKRRYIHHAWKSEDETSNFVKSLENAVNSWVSTNVEYADDYKDLKDFECVLIVISG